MKWAHEECHHGCVWGRATNEIRCGHAANLPALRQQLTRRIAASRPAKDTESPLVACPATTDACHSNLRLAIPMQAGIKVSSSQDARSPRAVDAPGCAA